MQVVYKKPTGKFLLGNLVDGKRNSKAEADADVERLKWFESDASVAALAKVTPVFRTAGWGRDDFRVAVQTQDGTQYLNPGDKLVSNGAKVTVVKKT